MNDRLGGGAGLDRATTHGLKNQLAIIIGFCELLARTLDEHDPRRKDLGRIEEAGQASLALLRDRAAAELGETS